MKKLLFLVVVAIGGSMLVKGNHVALTSDGQVRFLAWTFPLPAAVKASPLMGVVTLFAPPQAPMAAGVPPLGIAQARPGIAPAGIAPAGIAPAGVAPVAAPAALPVVTSAVRTYNPNPQPNPTPAPGVPANMADQFSAVSKALRPQ